MDACIGRELGVEGAGDLVAVACVDASGRVVYPNTFARSVSPTLRIAYMVLPQELSARFDRELGFYASAISQARAGSAA